MQKFLIVIWLLTVGNFIIVPSFPPRPPSAAGMIFFIALSAIATLICGKKLFLLWTDRQNQEALDMAIIFKTIVYGLLTVFGCLILGSIVYASLTGGIEIN
jgi:hypothetical protein